MMEMVRSAIAYEAYDIDLLNLIDLIGVIAGILVIISKNPIVSVLFLITLFFAVACHLIISGLTFIGLSYLLVYVGAVSILFLFILMLINIRISELINQTSSTIPLTLIIVLSIGFFGLTLLPFYDINFLGIISYEPADLLGAINLVSSDGWEASLTEVSNISALGDIMYTNYAIWLIITSFILLLSMVGAIIITIKGS